MSKPTHFHRVYFGLIVVTNSGLRYRNASSLSNMTKFLDEAFSLSGRIEVGTIRGDYDFLLKNAFLTVEI